MEGMMRSMHGDQADEMLEACSEQTGGSETGTRSGGMMGRGAGGMMGGSGSGGMMGGSGMMGF
jgi:hypothetical protein